MVNEPMRLKYDQEFSRRSVLDLFLLRVVVLVSGCLLLLVMVVVVVVVVAVSFLSDAG